MGSWKPEDGYGPDGRSNPVMWLAPPGPYSMGAVIGPLSRQRVESVFGDGKATRRISTYGHLGEQRDKKERPHFLCMRGGVPMHLDPGFTRYSHHLILWNEGYRTTGPRDEPYPPLVAGTLYALDTHAPHAVVPDIRLGTGPYKLDAVIDSDELMGPGEVAFALREFLAASPPPC